MQPYGDWLPFDTTCLSLWISSAPSLWRLITHSQCGGPFKSLDQKAQLLQTVLKRRHTVDPEKSADRFKWTKHSLHEWTRYMGQRGVGSNNGLSVTCRTEETNRDIHSTNILRRFGAYRGFGSTVTHHPRAYRWECVEILCYGQAIHGVPNALWYCVRIK